MRNRKLSIIIPTLNEESCLPRLLNHLLESENIDLCEIIVVDGGSKDKTPEIAQACPGMRFFQCDEAHRAKQMNMGAREAKTDILYFVHADTLPESTFVEDIENSISEGYCMGCYPFEFEGDSAWLRFNSMMTQYDWLTLRGGDQTLFMQRGIFEELQGYNETFDIMEEYDLISRARKLGKFKIMQQGRVRVSARKYKDNSYFRVNLANGIIFALFRCGVHPSKLKKLYYRLIKHPKAV